MTIRGQAVLVESGLRARQKQLMVDFVVVTKHVLCGLHCAGGTQAKNEAGPALQDSSFSEMGRENSRHADHQDIVLWIK